MSPAVLHPHGGAISKGHHYCVGEGEALSCCHCGDQTPYRMVLARLCPGASEETQEWVPGICKHGYEKVPNNSHRTPYGLDICEAPDELPPHRRSGPLAWQ